jgi:hypothetical protein
MLESQMTVFEIDREVLCLVNAFTEIKSRGTRRALLMLVEELAQKAHPLPPNKSLTTFEPAGVDLHFGPAGTGRLCRQ